MKIELPACLDDSAKELSQPVSREIGTTLGDLWYLAFGGLSQKANLRRAKYACELEKYRKELEERLNAVPENKLIEPSTQVVMNALMDSQSCVEEATLRSMYAKLIASASHADRAERVHPSFPGIIKQMSPTDAELLQMFKDTPFHPIVSIRLDFKGKGGISIYRNIFIPDTGEYGTKTQDRAVTCLSMLGLLDIDYTRSLVREGTYTPFEQLPEFRAYEAGNMIRSQDGETAQIEKVRLEKGMVSLTALGNAFMEVCT